ncbi:protein RER1 isoform X2 [Brevipalpus obovatus]|uniref:protein RER1 isoform X2 n=1 Tax=Brevipalpus obovatus TaxID=246614 RepID=UPI003D9F02CC
MEEEPFRSQPPFPVKLFRSLSRRYQSLLDVSTPYVAGRWIFSLFLLLSYMARVIIAEGWYIVTYGLGIFYLNLFIQFLSPRDDPALADDDLDDGPGLPTSRDDEFRPFFRRLPEFKFWHSATKATLIAMFCTLFQALNIPVFWPILLVYFFTLFAITMKKQIKHMYKYKYLPWTRGKTRYGGRADTGRVVQPK